MRTQIHLRWLILGPILGLTVIISGVVALEELQPQRAPADFAVDGLPPLAIDDAPACIRRTDADPGDLLDGFAAGGRVASSQITACPQAWDGRDVTFIGEAIGELIRRDGGVWVHVNDDAYALEIGPLTGHRQHAGFNSGLPVWLPDGLHEQIAGVGRPEQRGDVIAVRGVVHRADPDDGGSLTIRAQSIDVLDESRAVHTPFHGIQAAVAGALAVAAVASLGWARQRRRR
ncbi:MAG: hypothetical protein WD377_05450 [Nitriliruptoraceae bacterium]